MTVTVNGNAQNLPSPLSVQDLLATLSLDPLRVAVEHNRAIVPRERFGATTVNDGDTLEIVQFVGGG